MFLISIFKADIGRLNGSGVPVTINGKPRHLRRKSNILSWQDENGLQERKILTKNDEGTLIHFNCANDATNSDGCEVIRPEIVGGRIVMREYR